MTAGNSSMAKIFLKLAVPAKDVPKDGRVTCETEKSRVRNIGIIIITTRIMTAGNASIIPLRALFPCKLEENKAFTRPLLEFLIFGARFITILLHSYSA
jgi:hypothetical protein